MGLHTCVTNSLYILDCEKITTSLIYWIENSVLTRRIHGFILLTEARYRAVSTSYPTVSPPVGLPCWLEAQHSKRRSGR